MSIFAQACMAAYEMHQFLFIIFFFVFEKGDRKPKIYANLRRHGARMDQNRSIVHVFTGLVVYVILRA